MPALKVLDTASRVLEVIEAHLATSRKISLGTRFIDLPPDDYYFQVLAEQLEDAIGIPIDPEELETLATVGEVVTYIVRLSGAET